MFVQAIEFEILEHLLQTVTRFHAYRKYSKILNIFLFLFSNEMLVIKAEIYEMLVRIANTEDPDQTASSEAV